GDGGANGVYTYGRTSRFPTSSYQSTNYWVDVTFTTQSVTVPAAPTAVTATAGDGSATVSWTAPSNGGSPITGYTVTPYVGATAQVPWTVTGNPPATSTTVTGLTNGTAYTFRVAATNVAGTGPASAGSNAVTPVGVVTVPGTPTGVSATAGDASAMVSWTAPSHGGSAITGYTVT
ncbi:fibronectin type III domain-containing protein, partial [Knoellia aerolata]|uniref:fibronectin type III domain-containing protein n=1 Tax=Knoellia aerolata TaxID=442954 RepID=UPI0005642F98